MYTDQECRDVVTHAEAGGKLLHSDDIAVWVAFRCADCCRRVGRFDVAIRYIEALDGAPHLQTDSVRQAIELHRAAIAERSKAPKLDDGTTEYEQPFPEVNAELPSLASRVWNFAGAMTHWAASGFPTRSQEQIEERMAICQACPLLQNNVCQKCGCSVDGLINKLAVATEACPDGRWK